MRIFEVFGEIFVLVAMVMVVLAVIFQKRPIHTAVIYLHGAAGILINAYITCRVFLITKFITKNTNYSNKMCTANIHGLVKYARTCVHNCYTSSATHKLVT